MTVEFSFGTWLCPQYHLTLDWHFLRYFELMFGNKNLYTKLKIRIKFFFKLLYVLLKFVYLITEYKRRKNVVFQKRWVKKGPVDFNFCSFQSNYREASLSVFKTAVCLSLFHSVCVCVCVCVHGYKRLINVAQQSRNSGRDERMWTKCVCVCLWVCVCEPLSACAFERERVCVCMCV
jgi:hypothetical protein